MVWSILTLLALIAVLQAESAVLPTEEKQQVDYGQWQLSDFVMRSPVDANKRVYKEAPEFLSQLAPLAAKNDTRAAERKGLTLTRILSDLRAADNAGSDVIPPPSNVASPLESGSTLGAVYASGNGVIPPPSNVALPLQSGSTLGAVYASGNDVIPPPSKVASPLQTPSKHGAVYAPSNGVIPPSSKVASPLQTPSKHDTVYAPSNGVIPPSSKVASPLQTPSTLGAVYASGNGVMPPPSKVASPIQTPSKRGAVYTSGSVIASSPGVQTALSYSATDPDVAENIPILPGDDYLGSESIFVTSDFATDNTPESGAANTAYASLRPDAYPEETPHLVDMTETDHYPSESIIVSSVDNTLNADALEPAVAGSPSSATPYKPKPLHNKEYNPNPTLPLDSDVDNPKTLMGGAVNPLLRSDAATDLETSPDTFTELEETQVSINTPNNKINSGSYSAELTSQFVGEQEVMEPIVRSNTVSKVATSQKKPVTKNSPTIKNTNKSPVYSSDTEKLPKTDDGTKDPPDTLKVIKKVETVKPSHSLQVPKVANTLTSGFNSLGVPKTDDKTKSSITKPVSVKANQINPEKGDVTKYPSDTLKVTKKVETVKPSHSLQSPKVANTLTSGSSSLGVPKTDDKSKSSITKPVSVKANQIKSSSNVPDMPKVVDKSKPMKTTPVTNKPDTSKSELPKAVKKTKPSNIMKVPDTTDKPTDGTGISKEVKTKSSVTVQTPKPLDEPNVWPSFEPISMAQAEEQKRKLMDKMLKWTELLQSQERERQEEYTELLKELRQLQNLEYQMYNQRIYPH